MTAKIPKIIKENKFQVPKGTPITKGEEGVAFIIGKSDKKKLKKKLKKKII